MRTFWNLGGNWLLFWIGFCLVEGFAIAKTRISGEHWRTLSGTFWAALDAKPVTMTLVLMAGVIILVGHFKGGWWR